MYSELLLESDNVSAESLNSANSANALPLFIVHVYNMFLS